MSLVDRITTAIARNNLPALKKLVRDAETANSISDGLTLLMACALDEDVDASLVQFLIDQGADVNAVESGEKYTALHFAARDQRLEIVETLLGAGAKADVRDAKGKTPLRHCLSRKDRNPAIVEMLQAREAKTKKSTASKTASKAAAATNKKVKKKSKRLSPLAQKAKVHRAGASESSGESSKLKAQPAGVGSKRKATSQASIAFDRDWKVEFNRLWKTLVPRRGPARTLQGEIIRLTGRLSDEAFRNGNINWKEDYENAWKFVGQTLHDKKVFPPPVLAEITRHVRWILRHKTTIPTEIAGSPYDELTRRAVEWCLAHPRPVAHNTSKSRYSF